jgi:hypothetical protein
MSKQALISPNEPKETGYRVAQVEPDNQTFEVAEPLFWTPCADYIKADQFWYDPVDGSIQPLPKMINFITHNNLIATLTTTENNYLKTGDEVTLTNQIPSIYSGKYKINVIDEKSFTYTLNEIPESDAIEVGIYTINY